MKFGIKVEKCSTKISLLILINCRDMINDTDYYVTLHNTDLAHPVNVSLTIYGSACLYYDTNSSMWNTSGCSPNEKSNQKITVCDCNHMTMFGATVQYTPIVIDFEDLTVCSLSSVQKKFSNQSDRTMIFGTEQSFLLFVSM